MNKKEAFVKMVEELLDGQDTSKYADAIAYFETFKSDKKAKGDKPKFTDNGKLILRTMIENQGEKQNLFKARDIAELAFISSRSVSGSIRKLITDGYVDKMGQDPIIYTLTDEGKSVELGDLE